MRQESIEDIILKYSRRGMPVLRELLPENYCLNAAEKILSWKRGTVLLTTGFYVAGYAETDGPLGTMALAGALRKLGFFPVIVTDRYCEGYFEAEDIAVEYMDLYADDAAADAILEKYQPVGLISVERCGRDLNGIYANMRHVDISAGTAPCDALFLKALGTIPTIGVGDGGNEIGILVIATVSNWGAYGIVAALEQLTRLPLLLSFSKAERFLRRTVGMGSVDGISHEHIVRVDGFGMETEKEILDGLHEYNSVRLHALAS